MNTLWAAAAVLNGVAYITGCFGTGYLLGAKNYGPALMTFVLAVSNGFLLFNDLFNMGVL